MKKLSPLDFYLLRTPTYPFEKILRLNRILDTGEIDKTREVLRELFSEPNFKSALYLASIEFYNLLEQWLSNYNSIKNEEKFLLSIHRYYSRMSTRATPYGMFAGFSCGSITSNKTEIQFADKSIAPYSRIDMKFAEQLKDEIFKIEDFRKKVLYFPNNTIYHIGNKLRYIEYTLNRGSKIFSLAQISSTQILNQIISISEKGITILDLVNFVKGQFSELPSYEIISYIESLINSQVLVDHISPFIINNFNILENFTNAICKVNDDIKFSVFDPIVRYLKDNQSDLNLNSLISTTNYYRETINIEVEQIIQVDLKRVMNVNNININVINEIVDISEKLMKLEKRKTSYDLINFKTRFYSKFEDREVPLNIAIDVNTGVGYGLIIDGNVEASPLLDKIKTFNNSHNEKHTASQLENFISDKLNESILNNSSIIIIKDEDFDGLDDINRDRNFSNVNIEDYHLIGTLLANSQSDMDKGEYKFLPTSNSPTPSLGNLLSRFATSDDILREKMAAYYKNDSKLNSSSHLIVAEIIHNPGGKVGNILVRPNYYKYEIPYLSNSDIANDSQIPINDIMVSVRNNKLFIRSKKLNKEIIPKLTSAHNFMNENLPVFRFLCDYYLQSVNSGFSWDWGDHKYRDFLPRVEYKKFILSPAYWTLKCPKNVDLETFLINFLKKHNLPKYCLMSEGDNNLFIDTTNRFCLKQVLLKLKANTVVLTEFLSDSKQNIIEDSEFYSYTSEVIIPIENSAYIIPSAKEQNTINNDVIRNYFPGEEWIYFKIYCSNYIGDEILFEIKEMVDDLIACSTITKWFFIRYGDPDNHLRIRFKLRNDCIDIYKKILKTTQEYRNDGLIDVINVDTYKREIERYGANCIDESESLFYFDSQAILKFLFINNLEGDEDIRWKIAFLSVDILLKDFGLTISEKHELMEKMSDDFISEFVDQKNKRESQLILKRSLNQKLRNYKVCLDSLLETDSDILVTYKKFIQPFNKRSVANADSIRKLYILNDTQQIYELIRSYIHMSINRFFNSKQRTHEMIIYYFLSKSYESILARKKQNF